MIDRKSSNKMRLSTVVSIVFILHIHWVCGDSNITVLPKSVEKSAAVEKSPEIQVKHSDDSKNVNIEPSVVMNKLLQNQQEQGQQSSIEDESVESNEDYSLEAIPYDVGTYRSIRSAPQLQDRTPVQVRTYAHNGGLSGCSCFCPPVQPCGAAPPSPPSYYALPPPAPYPLPLSLANYPPPHYPPPNAYAYARNAPDSDDNKLMDSMTEEARFRSTYADQPAYPAPAAPAYQAPAQPAYEAPAPSPAVSYAAPQTYQSPASNVRCGQNLLVGCAPTVTRVPCSASSSY